MAGKRKLTIEILGENKVAAAALDDTGKRVDRVGESMTKFGGVAVAAGAAVAAGLVYAAKESENAEKQSRKLDNSIANSTNTYAKNGDGLRDLAGAIQKKTAADADDIIGMQSRLVQSGLEEDQIKSLTPLVVDLSRKMGVDLDTAAKVVAKSVDGSAGALKKMNINIDDAKLAVDPFTATMEALNGTVGGFAEEEGATFSGQLERLKNQLGDLTEGAGKGAISVVSGLADAAGGVSEKLSTMNPAIAETGGRLAAIGAISSVVVGGLSMAAGQAIKMRDTLYPLSGAGDDASRSLSKVGIAAAGIGAVGAAIAVYQIAGALNEASRDAVGFETSLNRATTELNKTGTIGVSALAKMAEETQGLGDGLYDLTNRMTGMSTHKFFLDGTEIQIDDMTRALANLKKEGKTDELQAALDALGKAEWHGKSWGAGKEDFDKFKETLASYRENLGSAKDAQDSAAGSMDGLGTETEETTSAIQEYADQLKANSDPIFATIKATDAMAEAKNKVTAAQMTLSAMEAEGKQGTMEYAAATADLTSANEAQVTAAFNLEGSLATLAAGVENGTVSTDQFNQTLRQMVADGRISAEQAKIVGDRVVGVGWQMAALDGRRARVTVDADTEAAMQKLRAIGAQMNVAAGWAPLFGGSGGRDGNPFTAYARGGNPRAGELALVGEEGPELVRFKGDATVYPAGQTAAMMRGGGRAVGGDTFNFYGPVARDSVRWVADQVAEAKRQGIRA